jgi:NADP-reducing hydrogenase subunit HndD
MEVLTHSPRVLQCRKDTLELILSDHNQKCLSCERSGKCELQKLSTEYGANCDRFDGVRNNFPLENASEWLVRDNNKCILCRRCSATCQNVQGVSVIGANDRGFATNITCAFKEDVAATACVACGQCINVCPTGALREKSEIDAVYAAIADPTKHVIVGTAPSVRVALGEEFGYPYGYDMQGKMVAALRRLGFDKVFDVDVTADLTIMEEGFELLGRLKDSNATLPMITSCSPGWIRYIEINYPELLAHLSSCKSPQQMFGALCKTYYAEKMGLDAKDIFVATVMPCVAKKFEKTRHDQSASGFADIDAVLTTRELAKMIKTNGIIVEKLALEEFDQPLGISSGAGLIFGASGGVMEAALRTVAEHVNGVEGKVEYHEVRGAEGIKEATYNIGGIDVNVCVVNGIGNAKRVMESIKAGECRYHFIEIMTCPGGCINGGGQPIVPSSVRNTSDIVKLRAAAIYNKDKDMPLRKSHNSPVVIELYANYFGEPNSHKAHEILHTKYQRIDKYGK